MAKQLIIAIESDLVQQPDESLERYKNDKEQD